MSDAISGTLGFGGAVYSLSDTSSISIIILNTTFSNCSAAQGGLYTFLLQEMHWWKLRILDLCIILCSLMTVLLLEAPCTFHLHLIPK